MMKSKIFKTILSISLAAVLSLTPASLSLAASGNAVSGPAVSASGNAEIKGKDEVITLSSFRIKHPRQTLC